MKVENLDLGNLFLAPMAGITKLPFRLLCKKYGASMAYSEMINADAYLYESPKTKKKAFFIDEERPIGIQLTGASIDSIIKAAKKIENELKPDLIDINVGCPAYCVMKTGQGAALLKEPEKLKKIVEGISKSVKIPLTCKMRILNDENKTIEIAKLIEKSGAKALTIHGRTAKQKYSGKANWQIIQKIKKFLNIPVILNGDVKDEISAKKAFETGCDAIMIGRAAIGNPFIFARIKYYLEKNVFLPKNRWIEDFNELVYLCKKYDFLNLPFLKYHAYHFVKGIRNSAKVREEISNIKDIEELMELLGDFEKISKKTF